MVKKILLPLLVGYIAFLIFMPKTELYFMLENKLAENDITLNEKSIDEGWFTLNVNEITAGCDYRRVKLFYLVLL